MSSQATTNTPSSAVAATATTKKAVNFTSSSNNFRVGNDESSRMSMQAISMEFTLRSSHFLTRPNGNNGSCAGTSTSKELDGCVIDEEDVAATKEHNNEDNDQPQQPDGTFFGQVGVIYGIVAIVYITLRTVWLLQGYWWSRNSIGEIEGLGESALDGDSYRRTLILNVHAFLGMTLIGMISHQYLSASYFRTKYHTLLRKFHRMTGRTLVVLWPICISSGMVYQFVDMPMNANAVPIIVGGAIGLFSLVNLVIGYFAIAHKKNVEDRNFYLHKAGMFFSMHYAISFTVSILVVGAIQLAFLKQECHIGKTGEVLGSLIGFVAQSVLLFGYMYKVTPELFKTWIVKMNIVFLLVHHSIYALLLIGVFFIVGVEMSEEIENTCFA